MVKNDFTVKIITMTNLETDPRRFRAKLFENMSKEINSLSGEALSEIKMRIPEKYRFVKQNTYRKLYKGTTNIGFAIQSNVGSEIWNILERGTEHPRGPLIRWAKGRKVPMYFRVDQIPSDLDISEMDKFLREYGRRRLPGLRILRNVSRKIFKKFEKASIKSIFKAFKRPWKKEVIRVK